MINRTEIYRKKSAFTLAEVLLTLLIIGVVSGLVVPNLINDTQNAEFKTAWKKEYSTINQSYIRLLFEEGGTLKNLCPVVDWVTDSNCIMNKIKTYLNVQKSCSMHRAMSEGCWHPNDGSSTYLNGVQVTVLEQPYPGLVLSDGTIMYFSYGNGSCSANVYNHNNTCITVSVDVNGFKKPNRYGKDIYRIAIYPTQIKPFGANNDTYNCSGDGFGCSSIYLYQ